MKAPIREELEKSLLIMAINQECNHAYQNIKNHNILEFICKVIDRHIEKNLPVAFVVVRVVFTTTLELNAGNELTRFSSSDPESVLAVML